MSVIWIDPEPKDQWEPISLQERFDQSTVALCQTNGDPASPDMIGFHPDRIPALINALFDLHAIWALNHEPSHTHQPGNADGLIEPR